MESALIITYTEKSAVSIAELLRAYSEFNIVHAHSAGKARRILLERDFDFVIINAPMPDETGENLARQIAIKELSQVILIVNSEIYEMVSAVCESDGILTISKPMDKEIFRQALSLAKSMHARLLKMQTENESIKQKIENIRIVDRAKSILISSCGMSEQEAHRYIEKKAMDTRTAKRAVSERIIHNYENGTKDSGILWKEGFE